MTLPKFFDLKLATSSELRLAIANRVRVERRKQDKSQREFAEHCTIPLRTYKRFELGKCDSLDVFIRIVMAFDRITAIDLLFPTEVRETELRDPLAIVKRMEHRRKQNQES